LKAWPFLGIAIVQGVLLLAHWFIYGTLVAFWSPLGAGTTAVLRAVIFTLAFSFMVAALLGFAFSNPVVAGLYKIAALWLGFLNFFFWAAWLSWIVWLGIRLAGLGARMAGQRGAIADVLFFAALATGIYGLVNARWIRVRRVAVHMANLPAQWRGRVALLASDLHLGNVNGPGFARRIAAMVERFAPDIVFFPGDVFDGSKADPDVLIAPLKAMKAPLGSYYSTGNHDEFGGAAQYDKALTRVGVRVLTNEMVLVDGLQVVGVPYADTTYPMRFKAMLEGLKLDPAVASVLLNHVPNRLPIVEQAGVGLQLSGHTHGGQMFPFNWITRRVFGKFTYGLQAFGELKVYTSSGAGTWGPPMRVGTHPEVVLLRFE